jgi:hypothetical protein
MAKEPTSSKRLQVSISQETCNHLATLAKTGMFGSKETDVARSLIEEGIRQAFRDGFFGKETA